jgi:Protein of unknown function (DUF1018)
MNTQIKHLRQLVALARAWAEKSLTAWGEDAHRDLLARHGARPMSAGAYPSSTSLSVPQLEAVLADYEARGWPRRRGQFVPGFTKAAGDAPAFSTSRVVKAQPQAVPPQIAHMVRLWARLGQAGRITNASRPALLVWVERQVGHTVLNLDALTPAESQRVIESLKAFASRA